MIRNYLKIAWRNLLKNKGFSLINITGLALGIGCFIVITMYVVDELSYDEFHANADDIYRINSDIKFGGVESHSANSSDMMAPTLKSDFPEVIEYTRLRLEGGELIKNGNQFVDEQRVAYADSTFFNVFNLPVVIGDAKTALQDPNSVVINKSTAQRYFGSAQNAIGKSIEVKDAQPNTFKIAAIIEDLPRRSHFHFDFIFSMGVVDYDWGSPLSHNFHSYVLLKEGTDYQKFNDVKIDAYLDRHILPAINQFIKLESMQELEANGNLISYALMPLKDIHLRSSQSGEIEPSGNIQYVYIFSAIAIFILLIACINFINLTTARSESRAKEVGIRKVLGTERKNLIAQFLSESTLIAVLATFFAILFVTISLQWFNTVAGKEMDLSILLTPGFIVFIVLLPIGIGALAGFYPALYLSAFKPIKVLKGSKGNGNKNDFLRNFLVVFQFAASIALIIGTIVIYSQLNHIQNTDVGFNKDGVLTIDNSGIDQQTRIALKNDIAQLTAIEQASFGGFVPVGGSDRSDTTFFTETVISDTNGFSMQNWNVDYDYISTLGIELKEGRNFDKSRSTDSTALVVNQATVRAAGFKDPIGKKLYLATPDGNMQDFTIVGVVNDFNYESLRDNVQPLGMRLRNNTWVSVFRYKTEDVSSLLSTIEQKYKSATAGLPFKYSFMDESFDTMYRQEQRVGKVALTFTILAVIIACLGLFGLTTYIAQQRRKEIGIRKVLGARVTDIVTMLSVDFVKLVVIAFVIAAPISWWVMSKWLSDFAFKTEMSWMIFAITGGIAILIATITLSFNAIKVAIVNPVKSLRTE